MAHAWPATFLYVSSCDVPVKSIGKRAGFTMILSFLLLSLCAFSAHASVTGYISKTDEDRLLSGLTSAFVKPQEDDVISAYYGVKGFQLLKRPLVQVLVMDTCAHLEKNFDKKSGPEATFHALSAYTMLNCKGKIHNDETIAGIKAALQGDKATPTEIRYAMETLKLLGQDIPNQPKIAQSLKAALKADDSLQSMGHALHAAALLGTNGKFMNDYVEDIVVQVDEVDGKMLQWEGGLTTTGLLITGLHKLQGVKPFNAAQVDKFSTYLLSRKSVQSAKGVVALIEAATAISSSTIPPTCITVVGKQYILPGKQELTIKVSDLLGNALKTPPSQVIATSAVRTTDDVVVLSKKALTKGSDSSEYVLHLPVEPGQYKINLAVGQHTTSIITKVLGPVNLESFSIGLGDVDGTSSPKYTKLTYPEKLPTKLEADATHDLFAKFSLSKPVHQAFFRLSSGAQEILFVAEKDSNKQYKIQITLLKHKLSGLYDIEVIIGDSIMSNPIKWNLGTININLPVVKNVSTVRQAKPEISHFFRPAEKRPPEVVSLLFTVLAASPLLLLLILWARIGINFGNFTFTAVPFHLGLGAILGLFALFWLRLDMFTTCAWLIPIGSFTFLAGHRLLKKIAQQKKH